jgi:prepilin-type N-terminal cleavage/methylation domain-containing protein
MSRSLKFDSRSAQRRSSRAGFTLVELLVVIVIIGGLIALAFPAIQAARATARRATSQSNLRQLALAILNYEAQNNKFPTAGRLAGDNVPRVGWITEVLPQLERRDLYDRYDFKKDWFADENLIVTQQRISVLIDPSSPLADRWDSLPEAFVTLTNGTVPTLTSRVVGITDYASIRSVDARLLTDDGAGTPNAGGTGITTTGGIPTGSTYASGKTLGKYVNAAGAGIMPPNVSARAADVVDGLSKTILLSESHGRPYLYRRGKLVNTDLAVNRVNGGGWSRNANDIRLIGFNKAGTAHIGEYGINAANGIDVVANGTNGQAPGYGTDGSGGIYSFHAGGAHVAFGDASVRFLSEKIDIAVLASLVTRDQNESFDEKLIEAGR